MVPNRGARKFACYAEIMLNVACLVDAVSARFEFAKRGFVRRFVAENFAPCRRTWCLSMLGVQKASERCFIVM